MKLKLIKIIPILAILNLFFACKKNGLGGETMVAAMPAHHGKMIKGCTVYVKFKTSDMPDNPTTNFDAKFVGDPTEDHVHIQGLLPGKYFLYAVGIDSSLVAPNNVVVGGVPLTITYSQRKSEIDLDIPVTEE